MSFSVRKELWDNKKKKECDLYSDRSCVMTQWCRFFFLGLYAFLLLITVSLWTGDLILFSFIQLISTAIEMTHRKKIIEASRRASSPALFSQPGSET